MIKYLALLLAVAGLVAIDVLPKIGPKDLTLKQGLDLQGGTEVVLEAEMGEVKAEDKAEALESVEEIIRRRVDLFGVSEPLIQRAQAGENYQLIVQLAGVKNIDQALALIGQTAKLEFRELADKQIEATTAGQIFTNFMSTGLTGKELKKASVQFGQDATGKPVVALEFSEEGKKLFSEITGRNVGKQVAVFLDELPVTIPVVQEEIKDGNAVITGDFSVDEAKQLAIQLNAGALPVPIKIEKQRTVGATLGADSVTKSLKAGAVGLAAVAGFMILMYGWLGVIADLGLVIYGLITLAIYKLVPVTLTLPGLAGFILSMGMAVDANILIFERMREEKKLGKPWQTAMELGFGRAWDSIKDANLTTIATAIILFNPLNWNFLPLSGLVRGFALTLGLGVIISLFTGVVVTRRLLRLLYRERNKK